MEISTQSAEETCNLGEKIGNYLKKQPNVNTACILLLQGELGSGKTTFMQGVAKGLGIPHRLVSPTYILVKEYEINEGNYQKLYHIDLYRLTKMRETDMMQFADIFANSNAICAVEWPERLDTKLASAVNVQFFVAGENSRRIRIEGMKELK